LSGHDDSTADQLFDVLTKC